MTQLSFMQVNIREKELTKKFREIVESIRIPERIAAEIAATLRESHEGKKAYYQDIYTELRAEYERNEARLEKMYDHFLDGKISEPEYDKRREGFKKKQVAIKSKLENLEETDDNYYTTCEYILKICQNAGQLFESSEPVVKRQILKLLLQDCVVDGVNLCATMRKPFDMFAEGSSRLEWLPLLGSNQGPSD